MGLDKNKQIEKIAALLEKYWEGETSVDEEANLRQYFNSGEVAEQFKEFIPLFKYYEGAKEMTLDDGFDTKILEQISAAKVIPLKKSTWFSSGLKIAASVLLLIAAGYFFSRSNEVVDKPMAEKGEISDPKLALQQVKRALVMVSEKMNTGNSHIKALSKLDAASNVYKNYKKNK